MNISVATWNIGYAGLGKQADFILEGGKSYMPSSRAQCQNYLEGIVTTIQNMIDDHSVDVFMIQELSRRSPSNIFLDVRTPIEELFKQNGYRVHYDSVFSMFGLFQHGQIIASKANFTTMRSVALSPFERLFKILHILRKLTLVEIPEYNLLIGNVHTTGYQRINLETERQVKQIFSEIASMRMKYKNIIIGGDWNMHFPGHQKKYDTRQYKSLPTKELQDPAGMQFVTAPYPTFRSLDKPYDGTNAVGNVDGFLVSSEVTVGKALDVSQNFSNTDHDPVLIKMNI